MIYAGGQAQLGQVRHIDLPSGSTRLVLEDVSPQLLPESVFLSGDGVRVQAQSFLFDPLSRRRLLEESLGQKVWVRRWGLSFHRRKSEPRR